MKIYLKDNCICFEKRFYTLKCEVEKDYKPENVPLIDESGIEVDDNEDIGKYIYDYCIKNNIHEYCVETVGDSYLFDDIGKEDGFVEDLLNDDKTNALDNDDYKYVDYQIALETCFIDNKIVYIPVLILKFDILSLNMTLIIETIQDYMFDSEYKAQEFCDELIELYKFPKRRYLNHELCI